MHFYEVTKVTTIKKKTPATVFLNEESIGNNKNRVTQSKFASDHSIMLSLSLGCRSKLFQSKSLFQQLKN
jgi:hypothetical protein